MRPTSSLPLLTGSGALRLPPAIASMLALSAESRATMLRPTYSQTIRAEPMRLSTTTPMSTPVLLRRVADNVGARLGNFDLLIVEKAVHGGRQTRRGLPVVLQQLFALDELVIPQQGRPSLV